MSLLQVIVFAASIFAWFSDLHYSQGSPSETALRECVQDVNSLASRPSGPEFVVVTGDLTDFGSDEQLLGVKSLLDSIRIPVYVIPGNHDAKWSESGCNSFRRIFGAENFEVKIPGWRLLGCSSGPDMRMAPALIPREQIRWLESKTPEPTIFFNHYPVDSTILNYGTVQKELRRIDTRLVLCGHMHTNRAGTTALIPSALCRSTLSDKDKPAGYNIVNLSDGSVTITERRPSDPKACTKPWFSSRLARVEGEFSLSPLGLPRDYPWTDYIVNAEYSFVDEVWWSQEDANIAGGFAKGRGSRAYFATVDGTLKCIDIRDGSTIWTAQLPGKVFSTPVFVRGKVIVGCAEGGLFAFNARSGKQLWTVPTEKSVLATPAVRGNRVFFGSSDGCFRAVNLRTGKAVWTFNGVEGFVECRPFVDSRQVVFGSWGRKMYSLDPAKGTLQWTWESGRQSRMYSPAACNPVKAEGRIFFTAPDRFLYVLDAATGSQLTTFEGGRESIGFDGKSVYVKTMTHGLYSVDTKNLEETARFNTPLGYDISPTELCCSAKEVIIPTDKGNIFAIRPSDGIVLWAHKISVGLVNPILKTSKNEYLVSTMDGTVCKLKINKI